MAKNLIEIRPKKGAEELEDAMLAKIEDVIAVNSRAKMVRTALGLPLDEIDVKWLLKEAKKMGVLGRKKLTVYDLLHLLKESPMKKHILEKLQK